MFTPGTMAPDRGGGKEMFIRYIQTSINTMDNP